jgi:RNA polymerase sigma factor (sigma-70 family)
VAAGDPDGTDTFAAELAAVAGQAMRVATVVLGARDGADDVVQVAMERAWRSRASYDVGRPFAPWFLRIVANTARNDRRQRGRHSELRLRVAGRATDAGGTPEDETLRSADRQAVLAALNCLDVADRTVLALRYVEQLGEEATAVVLGCAVGTVKSRTARAKQRLRELLDDGGAA